ncbi:hypothetical protein [Parachitinimonas caeni]|uniref:SHOCT domain-containing protein n=1 Tax=Parachitinimonas caeni TaxID=3031301 RepID=A0ABT7DVG7_9NEIS|nr:hypothetical protein [Parachitinimonas caeni]MDK2124057.1 hypothetical protein [Parachitinimonas caeni]
MNQVLLRPLLLCLWVSPVWANPVSPANPAESSQPVEARRNSMHREHRLMQALRNGDITPQEFAEIRRRRMEARRARELRNGDMTDLPADGRPWFRPGPDRPGLERPLRQRPDLPAEPASTATTPASPKHDR